MKDYDWKPVTIAYVIFLLVGYLQAYANRTYKHCEEKQLLQVSYWLFQEDPNNVSQR